MRRVRAEQSPLLSCLSGFLTNVIAIIEFCFPCVPAFVVPALTKFGKWSQHMWQLHEKDSLCCLAPSNRFRKLAGKLLRLRIGGRARRRIPTRGVKSCDQCTNGRAGHEEDV